MIVPLLDSIYLQHTSKGLAVQYLVKRGVAPTTSKPFRSWSADGRRVITEDNELIVLKGTVRYCASKFGDTAIVRGDQPVDIDSIKVLLASLAAPPTSTAGNCTIMMLNGVPRLHVTTRRGTFITSPIIGHDETGRMVQVTTRYYKLVGDVRYFDEDGNDVAIPAGCLVPLAGILAHYKVLSGE